MYACAPSHERAVSRFCTYVYAASGLFFGTSERSVRGKRGCRLPPGRGRLCLLPAHPSCSSPGPLLRQLSGPRLRWARGCVCPHVAENQIMGTETRRLVLVLGGPEPERQLQRLRGGRWPDYGTLYTVAWLCHVCRSSPGASFLVWPFMNCPLAGLARLLINYSPAAARELPSLPPLPELGGLCSLRVRKGARVSCQMVLQ